MSDIICKRCGTAYPSSLQFHMPKECAEALTQQLSAIAALLPPGEGTLAERVRRTVEDYEFALQAVQLEANHRRRLKIAYNQLELAYGLAEKERDTLREALREAQNALMGIQPMAEATVAFGNTLPDSMRVAAITEPGDWHKVLGQVFQLRDCAKALSHIRALLDPPAKENHEA